MNRLRVLLVTLVAILCGSAVLVGQMNPPATAAGTSLKEEMRNPWSRNQIRFIRHWLVVGAFPGDIATDYLAEHGGEAAIEPKDGLAHQRADGSTVKWHAMDSWGDAVGLADAVDAPKEGAVAYACATVTREATGPALLSVGSDQSIKVWLNGKLALDRTADRSWTPDEDQVPVDLKAGENRILVKLAQPRGVSTFSVRVLEPGAVLARKLEIGPSIVSEAPAQLAVKTDIGVESPEGAPVKVELVAAGGEVLAAKEGNRGATLAFDASKAPDGPYELRCATSTLAGRLYVTHLAWYKGDAIAKARELMAVASKADAGEPEGMTLKMLADMVVDRLGAKPEDVKGNPWWKIHSPLMEFDEIMLEAKGQPARVRPHGFYRLAYRDEVDGSPQFCRAYLPAGYDPAKKWPLVLQLHGYNPANPVYVRWWAADSRHSGLATEYANHQAVIYMEPHGRGNVTYLGMGDNDIMKVIALAKERFNVDEDRIYLTGDSMGGWGTWNVSTRHPDVFAAIAPVFGGVDYHSQLSEEELKNLTGIERFRQEKASSWAAADGLLHTPIFVHHGDVDRSVNVDFSRYGVRMLQRWGYDIRYHEYPGFGHEDLEARNGIIEWFLGHKREPYPRTVRLRTAQLKYASAFWVKVEQMASPLDFAVVDAEVIGQNRVRLDTQNVTAIVLGPASLFDARKPLTVIWNGNPRTLRMDQGQARLTVDGFTESELHKSSSLPGSIDDLTSTPFALVIGTISKDPDMAELCKQKADGFAAGWRNFQKQEPRLFKDVEMSEADMARYSLVLFGGPAANAVTQKLASKIPLTISADGVAIDGKSFKAPDSAIMMLYPNPLNPQRYVLIVAGTSADGMYFCDPSNRELGDWDFAISDGRVPPPAVARSPYKIRIASGVFDHNWRLDDGLIFEGDQSLRASSRLLRRPKPNTKVDPKVFHDYAGDFQIERGPLVTFRVENDKLVAVVGGQSPIELVPESESDFFVPGVNVRISFVRDASGKVTGLTGQDSGNGFTGAKLK